MYKKECRCCHELKSIVNFNKIKNGKYGVDTICKPCLSLKHKENYISTGNNVGAPTGLRGPKLTNDVIITRSIDKHGDKYDYSLVNYVSSSTKIKIICPEHGVFEQIAHDHMRGVGCKVCGNKYKFNVNKLSTEEFIARANEVHSNYYTYDNVVYINDNVKVDITCLEHGDFKQQPGSHVRNGSGCPKCRMSKGERLIRFILESDNIAYISEYKFKECRYKRSLPFDFYLPEHNTIIEYDGIQHFEPVNFSNDIKKMEELFKLTVIKDNIKNEFCFNQNISLVRIKYTESEEDIKIKIKGIING